MKKQKRSDARRRLPIGIFDSGLGGLTVLREVRKRLPGEDLIYFGDTARVPYGTKSQEAVRRYSLEIAKFLTGKNVKMIVVACNTASAIALDALKRKISVPLLGVVIPGSKAALRKTENNKIAIIGTEATIRSKSYQRMLVKYSNRPLKIYAKACPVFVPLVEEGWLDNKPASDTALIYLSGLKSSGIDTLILGCTHYPLLKPLIKNTIGKDISVIDSADATARETEKILLSTGLISKKKAGGSETYFVTDNSIKFRKLARRFLGRDIGKIRLVKVKS